jgi:acetyltransferase-like isoleucine patch superfamily enzyme
MNKLLKFMRVIERGYIKKLVYLSDAIYMKKLHRYLIKIGIDLEGTPKYIYPDVYFDGTDYSKIHLGDNITISKEVMFLTHDYSVTTAFAAIGNRINRGEGEVYILNDIKIGNNCFIGARVSILPGTNIGNNVIVGAGCVVKGKVPSNSIIIGNPWRKIGDTDDYAKNQLQSKNYIIRK